MDEGQSQRMRAEEESTAGASTSSSISSEATGAGSGQYDVFLSFRGLDTRKEFTDHLYHNLLKVGTVPFGVFKDDQSIPIGEKFGPQILNAITRSKISIPIISENYASSKWCLRELACMMECKKKTSHIVLPIFYKVAPSDVRHLGGNFGETFRLIQKPDEKDIQNWRQALTEVSHLHGWESQKIANGHEGKLIERVLETVISKLQEDFQLDVPKQLVGIVGPMKKVMSLLDLPSNNTQMVGIYGMGGKGKTTLAKCIYNQLLKKFDQASFLPDVRETTKRQGIMHLQGLLISELLKVKTEVSTIDYGINIIKSRFKGKKVLIFLDDIDHMSQLDALARECDWFMEGSLIIVTTRIKSIFDQSEFKVVHSYEMNELDGAQALLLFNRHAFRMDQSPKDFESVSRNIISTMGGLPLALKVVGSHLYKKTNKEVWEDVRKKLKSQPHNDVQEILRISYDALEDGHKQIFLDIVCFFIGENDKDNAYHMWEGCGLYPSEGIEELKLRCLINIGDDNEFEMHDQLRDLGRSIFCQGQPLEVRSGPWDEDYKGITRVLRNSGHSNIKEFTFFETNSWFNDWLEAASSEDSNQLLSEVRWLQWGIYGSYLSIWTTNLRLPNLLVLDLSCSNMTEEWEGWSAIRVSNKLRLLHLHSCRHLRCTPDLSAFTQLKILNLQHCSQLEHLHPSIGKLKSLVSLDLTCCFFLKELPDEVEELDDLEELNLHASGITEIPTSIGSLKKLKTLVLSNCKLLRGIPTSIGDLQNLQHLNMNGSSIENFPSSIGRLENLKKLHLSHCKSLRGIPTSIGDLQNLQHLYMSESPIEELPNSIERLESLQVLEITVPTISDVRELPSGLTLLWISCQSPRLPQLSSLIHLEELYLHACDLLEDIPELASSLLKLCVKEFHELKMLRPNGCKHLEVLSVKNCCSIETLDLSQLIHLKQLQAEKCDNLVEVQGLDKLESLENVFIYECNSIESLLFSESQCLKRFRAINCNNLVEVQGLDGVKFSKEHHMSMLGFCHSWKYGGS